MAKRWMCEECERIFEDSELLIAPNPFNPEAEIVGCPFCKSVDQFSEICDEPGCNMVTTCGFPTPIGYRRTCSKHSQI